MLTQANAGRQFPSAIQQGFSAAPLFRKQVAKPQLGAGRKSLRNMADTDEDLPQADDAIRKDVSADGNTAMPELREANGPCARDAAS